MKNPFKRRPAMAEDDIRECPMIPTIRFVNAMLYQMSVTNTPLRVLRQCTPLDRVEHFGEELYPPALQQVTNRLKVMSGLDPVHYKFDVSGQIQLNIAGKAYMVRTTLNDEIEELCKIEFIDANPDHLAYAWD
jgi:hypothetical protein